MKTKVSKTKMKCGGSKTKMKKGGVKDPAGNTVEVKRKGRVIKTTFAASEQPSTGVKSMKEVYDKNKLLKKRVEKTTSGKRVVTKNSKDVRATENTYRKNPKARMEDGYNGLYPSNYKMKKGGSKKKC